MHRRRRQTRILLIASLIPASAIRADDANVLTVWRLLDYMAIDYREAVRDGTIINANEYAEMVEFAGSVKDRLENLLPSAAKADLKRQAIDVQAAIDRKAAPETIATLARSLAADLIKAYPVPLAPSAVPDYARGRTSMPKIVRAAMAPTAMAKALPRPALPLPRSTLRTRTAPASAAFSRSIR